MKFRFFKDEIILDESMENNTEQLKDINEFVEKIRLLLLENGCSLEEVTVFYKRHLDCTSVLGIKLLEGDKYDLSNYVIFDAISYKFGTGSLRVCDVDMHASAKAADAATKFMRLANGEVNWYLNAMENRIHKVLVDYEEYDIMKTVPLVKERGGLLARLFNKKNNGKE